MCRTLTLQKGSHSELVQGSHQLLVIFLLGGPWMRQKLDQEELLDSELQETGIVFWVREDTAQPGIVREEGQHIPWKKALLE